MINSRWSGRKYKKNIKVTPQKLKAYRDSQKSETKGHIQQQQSERKAEREKIQSEVQSQKASTSAGQ